MQIPTPAQILYSFLSHECSLLHCVGSSILLLESGNQTMPFHSPEDHNVRFSALKTLTFYIAACRDPLLVNDRETNNKRMPAARQQVLDKEQLKYNRRTVFSTYSVPICHKQDNWNNE
jgi:hypothetical protein